ncbi:hypothetical protein Ddc_15589 [Ditylenchus destructor]|nr:hypothetical protein Ddc_15589 [Ditylenchus destructor]
MNLFDLLILTYPLKRAAWVKLKNASFDAWNDEVLDFACYAGRMLLLQIFHKKNPQLSAENVLQVGSYLLRRLFDVIVRKRPMFSWKMEMKALIGTWILLFLVECFVMNVYLGFLEMPITRTIEPLWWMAFIATVLPTLTNFPLLPLSEFIEDDELWIQPYCGIFLQVLPRISVMVDRVVTIQ